MRTYITLMILNLACLISNATTLWAIDLTSHSILAGMLAGACLINFTVAFAMIFGFSYFKGVWK